MKRIIVLALVAAVGFGASGCELNGLSSEQISKDILRESERVCGANADSPRGGIENIMLMEGREDDFIVTCADRTNHYVDA